MNRFVHDFINLDPSAYAKKRFRRFHFATIFTGGVLFAYATTDRRIGRDEWYSRPDLKVFPAMVPREDMDITERTAYESKY